LSKSHIRTCFHLFFSFWSKGIRIKA